MREGHLRILASPDQFELAKKLSGDDRPLRRRDPVDLLRMALPWTVSPAGQTG